MNITSNYEFQVIKEPLISFFFSLAKSFYYYINRFQRKLIFDAWSITNRHNSDEYLRVLFIGKNEVDKNYFCNLLFNEDFDEIYLGKLGIWRLLFFFWESKKNYDLIIVKSRMKFCNLLKSKRNFVIPDWIGCEIDLCCDIGSQSYSKRTLKSNLRKIKRGNFRYSISKDPVDFHFFYHNMHLPYISKRHGDSALKISYGEMKKSFENGELLQIKEGPEIVAGVIIDHKVMSGIPRLTKLGVLKGDFNYVKRGAIIALYYYTIQYLKEKNHEKFSLGSTRPFFSDGVLHHKLNWGAKIVCESPNAFLLSLLSQNKCLKSFLSSNPFIIQDRNNLNLANFSDHSFKQCPYLPKDENKLKSYGLDKMVPYSL